VRITALGQAADHRLEFGSKKSGDWREIETGETTAEETKN
jgi:hypothetical protein